MIQTGRFIAKHDQDFVFFGLAKATSHLTITQKTERMRQRLANKE